MKVTVAVGRIFGTDDQYGEAPRMRPPRMPLIFHGVGRPETRARVDFGPVPPEVVEAERIRRAIGRATLTSMFGSERPHMTLQEKVDDIYPRLPAEEIFGGFNWYATFLLEETLEVDPGDIAPWDFILPKDPVERAEEIATNATPLLDVVVSFVSSVLDRGVFDELLINDRVLFFADGMRPAGAPVLTAGAGRLSVKRGGSAVELLANRIDVLGSIDASSLPQHTWLTKVAHWHVQALGERDDPWKQFLWAFFGLEILVHQLFKRRHGEVLGRLRLIDTHGNTIDSELPLAEIVGDPKRLSLRARFAVVAADLFPDAAAADMADFSKVVEARNSFAHGDIRNADELPTAAVQGLLQRYLAGSIKAFILGVRAADSWEEIVASRHGQETPK
jgi:hypothetical protein